MLTCKKLLSPENETAWFWGIALLALWIQMVFYALLPISISSDTYGYFDLSHDLLNPRVMYQRTVGYSLFLKLLGTDLFGSLIPAILAQAAMAVAIPLVVFRCLIHLGLGYAVLGGLTACAFFYNFVVSHYILTDAIYPFLTALYTFAVVRYFQAPGNRRVLEVIGAIWLIALLRVSGSIHFLSFLVGMFVIVIYGVLRRNSYVVTMGLRRMLIVILVYVATNVAYGLVTDRTSSVIWPNFVFNWMLLSPEKGPIYYGALKPENGPAATRLFKEIETMVTENPGDFAWMKSGSPKNIQDLQPEKDGKYSPEAVTLLMEDIIHNRHETRSWWILNMLVNNKKDVAAGMQLAGDAIVEAFVKHPELIVDRSMFMLKHGVWEPFLQGITVNNISLPTAYHQQINESFSKYQGDVGYVLPITSLRPGYYKQWAYDLYQHTGTDPAQVQFDYPNKFPTSWDSAYQNLRSDNLIGFGHYIAMLGTQIVRVCWALIALGIVLFPFSRHKTIFATVLCASIFPPLVSVFLSEVDLRHLLMSSPVQIVAAVMSLQVLVNVCQRITKIGVSPQYAS